MKKRCICAIFALLFCVFGPGQSFSASAAEGGLELRDGYTLTTFRSGFGDTPLLLKTGFDFIGKGSGAINWDLALTGAALSGHVYGGTDAESLFRELGYDECSTTTPDDTDANAVYHPVATMAYKQLSDGNGNKRNLFAVVVRGTSNLPIDLETDFVDGAETMFDKTKGNVEKDLEAFLQEVTGRSLDTLKQEDNYFFFTGHSLGGAVANALSVDATVTELCGGSKEHIYTYTYEAPHTCVNLWWMDVEGMSNAFNFKDVDDAVTNVAPYIGATTYGKDRIFSVNDLDDHIFKQVFPNAKGGSATEAPHPWNYGDVFGHHDRGLCLVYILQYGIGEGWWEQVYRFDDVISTWPEELVAETPSSVSDDPPVQDSDDLPAQDSDGAGFLIGDWSTSDGVSLSFYADQTFRLQWGFFPGENGSWYAEPLSGDTLYIEMDGSTILSLMSMLYGSTSSDYHFEILKRDNDSFYLVQVYDEYTAQTSPCKLGFSRTSGR